MKHLGKILVILVSLSFAAAGCGGDSDDGGTFTQQQAVEATKVGLAAFIAGTLFAAFELGGQSGDFDIEGECDSGGTTTFSGTMTVVSDTEVMVEMDATANDCGDGVSTVNGTLHYEGTTESFDISGSYTFSGDTLSGTCTFDLSATYSDDGETIDVTGTACGQNVSGPFLTAELIDAEG